MRISELNAQELANLAWVFSKADLPDVLIFAVLARVAKQHMGNFAAQNLANTAWAFTTMELSVVLRFEVLARAVKRQVGKFSSQDPIRTSSDPSHDFLRTNKRNQKNTRILIKNRFNRKIEQFFPKI